MRNMMVSTLAEDYVLTATAKGLRPRRVAVGYAARNAVLPSLAGFAISIGFVVSGSIVAEAVFSYPGVGFTLYQAVQNNDYALMQAIFLVITLAVLGANFLVDILYAVVDPRTRQAYRP
jgi:peptide/nickel transport system permease protein